MINAGRAGLETLLLLWALTREVLAIVTTTACPDGRTSCPGYQDDYENKYCCPSPGWVQPGGYYCCNYAEKEMYDDGYYQSIPEIIGGVVGAAFLLASVLVLSCFFCRCCYVYKYRHRKRSGGEADTAGRRASSTLGWRYRNWPIPTSSTCNGTNTAGSGSNRYYYTSRPYRENTGNAYARYQHPPRSRRLHSRLGENCCHLDNENVGYAVRSPSSYSSYLYEQIHAILGEVKPLEAPPPYPVANQYPTFPPVALSDTQLGPSAVTPISTSTSAATTSTVIQGEVSPGSTTANCAFEPINQTGHGQLGPSMVNGTSPSVNCSPNMV